MVNGDAWGLIRLSGDCLKSQGYKLNHKPEYFDFICVNYVSDRVGQFLLNLNISVYIRNVCVLSCCTKVL